MTVALVEVPTLPTGADNDLDARGYPVRTVVARWIRVPRWRWTDPHPARARSNRDPVSRDHGTTAGSLTTNLAGMARRARRAGSTPIVCARPLPRWPLRHRLLADDDRGANRRS